MMQNKIISGAKAMFRNILIILFPVFVCFLTLNCAGGRGNMKFKELKYPVSMSAYLYGPKKQILVKDKDLKVIEHFKLEKTFWGIGYGYIKLSNSTNSEKIDFVINKNIEKIGGQGVVNLSITTKSCTINEGWFFNLLPFWPGCTDTIIEGDIVKMK